MSCVQADNEFSVALGRVVDHGKVGANNAGAGAARKTLEVWGFNSGLKDVPVHPGNPSLRIQRQVKAAVPNGDI